MFVYAVPPQFISDIVPQISCLATTVRAPGRFFSRVNHFRPLISLDHLGLKRG